MSAHTPGLTDDQARKALLAVTVHDDLMAENAKLRALNAKLLEACKAALSGFALLIAADDLNEDERRQVELLQAAIAKAEGRE